MKLRTVSRLLFAACICAVVSPSVSMAQDVQPIFCFWRRLPRVSGPFEYQKALTPLPSEVAAQCCSVHPGQALAIVRNGRIVASGEVDQLYAALVPRAGDDRMLFFSVSGLPDSVGVSSGPPPFPKPDASTHDLYVVGAVSVEKYEPSPSARQALEHGLAQAVDAKDRNRRTLDYFLKVDGVPYAILRFTTPNTGMWGYLVYKFTGNHAPELVYSDCSWST